MQFKAATPLGESFAAGVHVNYTDKIAAGQIDPRAESYHYSVCVKPGAVWVGGSSRIGLNGLYTNTFERSTPSISNTQEVQKVFMLRGLGNWVGEQVGSNGLGTMYFRCNTWGGALQYAFEGSWNLLAELSYANHGTRITEKATQPKPYGNTVRQEFGMGSSAVFGKGPAVNKLGMYVSYTLTNGIEPTVQWNKSSGEWEVQAELEQCRFVTADLDIRYDRFIREGDGYNWHLSSGIGLEAVHDSYATPYSEFQYGLLSAVIGAEYKFRLGKGSLLAGSTVVGVKNLGDARYTYSGHRTGTAPVEDLYPHNLAVLASDRIQGRLSAEYCTPLSNTLSLAFAADCSGLVGLCSTLGTLRRASASGAVKLYF
jgi:hypothetical protein